MIIKNPKYIYEFLSILIAQLASTDWDCDDVERYYDCLEALTKKKNSQLYEGHALCLTAIRDNNEALFVEGMKSIEKSWDRQSRYPELMSLATFKFFPFYLVAYIKLFKLRNDVLIDYESDFVKKSIVSLEGIDISSYKKVGWFKRLFY